MYTLFFLFLLKNTACGYSLEPPRLGGSNEYPQSMFWAELWKILVFFVWKKIIFFGGTCKIFSIFQQTCFRNAYMKRVFVICEYWSPWSVCVLTVWTRPSLFVDIFDSKCGPRALDQPAWLHMLIWYLLSFSTMEKWKNATTWSA